LVPRANQFWYGFSYTQPAVGIQVPTVVVAGGGNYLEGVRARGDHRAGRYVARGLQAKATFVMELMKIGCADWEATGRR